MEVRVLGPVEVVDGSRQLPIGPKERCVIARLAAGRGRVVSDEVLIDVLWHDAPPASARKTLHGYIHRIRRAAGLESVLRVGDGYLLGPTVALDIDLLEQELAGARRAAADGLWSEAAALFQVSRSRFRGDVLSELCDDPTTAGLRRRFAELENAIDEELAMVELRLGNCHTVIGELEALVATDATRERGWCLLVGALASDGRQADALNAVARARRALALELGVEPGPQLRELEQLVLDQDSSAITATLNAMFGSAVASSTRPSDAITTPLPVWNTSFHGRSHEIAWLADRVRESRLVVLTGTGGIGKTRLAMAVAGQVMGEFSDGVLRVGLAGIADDDVDSAIAAGVQVRREPFRSVLESVASFLADRRVLLLVDNCEEVVVPVGRAIGELLARCQDLHVLATSRQPLRLPGELSVPVGPLDHGAARELLADRVATSAASPLPSSALVGLDRLCERLDGMPLALELAAAHCRTMTADEFVVRLDRQPAVLADRRGVFEERHRDLDHLIEWSCERLSPLSRLVIGRLTSVVGGFTLDTAEGVAGGDGVDDLSVLQALEELEDAGLVVREDAPDGARHRLLEPIRQHVVEALDAAERDRAIERHAHWFRDLATSIRAGWTGQHFRMWADLVERDLANFRDAHRRFVNAADAEGAVHIVQGLAGVALERGILEVADWCDATVGLVAARRDRLEAAALAAAVPLWWLQNRLADVTRAAELIESMPEADLEDRLIVESVAAQAVLDPRDWASTIDRFERALSRFDPGIETWAGAATVMFLVQLGARDEVEAIKVARRVDSAVLIGRLAFYRAIPHYLNGDPGTAAVIAGEAAMLARDVGMTVHLAVSLAAQGEWRARSPESTMEDVCAPLLESLDLWARLRVPWGRVSVAEEIAQALVIRGEPEVAFVLWGAADATGIAAPAKMARPSLDPYTGAVAAERRDAWRRRGETMTLEDALSEARHVLVAALAERPAT